MAAISTVNRRTQPVRPYLPPQIASLLLLIVVLGVVEVAVASGVIPRTIVARPSDAIMRIFESQNRSELFSGFLTTFGMTAVAITLETAVAIPLGFLLYYR